MHIETNAFHLSSCFAASGIKSWLVFFFFSYACHEPLLVSHETASSSSSSAECSRDKPPFSFVRGHDSTMWDIVWISPQGHRSMSVSRHFLLQAPQCSGVARNIFRGEQMAGVWGREPPVGSRAEAPVGVWGAKPPRS